MCDMLVPDNYGNADSVEELQAIAASRLPSSASGHNEAGIQIQIQVCKPAAGGFWGSSSGTLWHLNIM
ncbi:GM22408 [Drosophila sechellia]|uniref:GM22408 n=1 Tax=Drosophila sechellia TaxID=7238 RepID=B4IAW0_DROSE|nr:GM22408 [Drosophila sechellia]